QCRKSLPLRLEWRHVHNNSATRIGRLSNADRQYIPGDTKIFHRTRQCERVWRHNDRAGPDRDKGTLVEGFGIDKDNVDIGKNLEFFRNPEIVAVGGEPVGNYVACHLLLAEGLD